MQGRHASNTIPFGDSELTFVVSPRRPLGGTFAQRLPWAVGILGLILSLGAGALTVRMIDRRNHAQRLASSLEQIADEDVSGRRGTSRRHHGLAPLRDPRLRR
jgi:hypothetical protein